jgi:hypothetical protein
LIVSVELQLRLAAINEVHDSSFLSPVACRLRELEGTKTYPAVLKRIDVLRDEFEVRGILGSDAVWLGTYTPLIWPCRPLRQDEK